MHWEKLNDNCIFAFLPELEPLFGVQSLLGGEAVHTVCTDLYGTAQIAAWKRRYRFLFETHHAVERLEPYGMADSCLELPLRELTLETLQRAVLSMPAAEFLSEQVGWSYFAGASKDELQKALTEDAALDRLYEKAEKFCPNFLGFSAFVRSSERYIKEYFALAAELQTPALAKLLATQEAQIKAMRGKFIDGLRDLDPLECSQRLMGKTFRNRGPYEEFYFLPSLLLPFRAMRHFRPNGTPHNRQLLFLSLRTPENRQERVLQTLRALSDKTRYQILMLLSKNGPMRGLDIAKELSLAPSTVSHHMEQLKESGLTTEEQQKTTKYYGLNPNNLQTLLAAVAKDLHIE